MHKILAAAAALGLLALPLQTSAQTTNQPAANKDAANSGASTKNTTTANTTKKASTNKHTLKRKTQASKTKRLAKHGRKPHYAKATHGKRMAHAYRGRPSYGFTGTKSKRHHRHHLAN